MRGSGMRLRRGWMLCWLACAGCQALGISSRYAAPDAAEICWRQGQTAMRAGRPELAVEFYEKSLAADPSRAHDHLSLAAAHAECGAAASACVELAQFLER